MHLSQSFFEHRKLEDVVENKTSYELTDSALHVFETYQKADNVCLRFENPVLASMLQGKKVMHLKQKASFDFLPGESLVMPSNEQMCIDFPDAKNYNPTRCLALEISSARIQQVVELMNANMTRPDGATWEVMDYNFHFTNDASVYQILQRLVYLYTENHPSKQLFVSSMVQELIIRILQTNTRKAYQTQTKQMASTHRFAFVTEYIRQHLSRPISVKELSELVCMSESNFYRVFKQELGMSPIDYINNERVQKAKTLLKNFTLDITEVYLACGFTNRSYFNRLFKRIIGTSPSAYQSRFA